MVNFLSKILGREPKAEPEIIGNVSCLPDHFSVDVRAEDGSTDVTSLGKKETLFLRTYTIALKGDKPAQIEQFLKKSSIPKRYVLPDGTVKIGVFNGEAFQIEDGLEGLFAIMKGHGVIISKSGINEILEADITKHIDKYMKPIPPKARDR